MVKTDENDSKAQKLLVDQKRHWEILNEYVKSVETLCLHHETLKKKRNTMNKRKEMECVANSSDY
jgi:hypothetical protein